MGWQIGYINGRDVGYGVPAKCDHPKCDEDIDRGLSYICGDIGGVDYGCGLYFCENHRTFKKPRGSDIWYEVCDRCDRYRPPFKMKPDVPEWVEWKLTDESWAKWREENPTEVETLRATIPPQKRIRKGKGHDVKST